MAKVGNFYPTSRGGTEHPFVEHPLRSSTNLVNLVSRSTVLVDLNLVDLGCLGNFWWSGAENSESRAGKSLPNRPFMLASTDFMPNHLKMLIER